MTQNSCQFSGFVMFDEWYFNTWMGIKPVKSDLLKLYNVNLEMLLLFIKYISFVSYCVINIYSHRGRKMFLVSSCFTEIMFHYTSADEGVIFSEW